MTSVNDIESLFRNNYSAMFLLAVRILHDREIAGDIVHDIFASLLSGRAKETELSTVYLMTAVRNNCLQYLRNLDNRSRVAALYALDLDEIEDEEWPDEEDISKINAILENELSESCRRVVRMRFTLRMSYREISEEIGISETAVYKHLRHALNVLRQKFNDYD